MPEPLTAEEEESYKSRLSSLAAGASDEWSWIRRLLATIDAGHQRAERAEAQVERLRKALECWHKTPIRLDGMSQEMKEAIIEAKMYGVQALATSEEEK